MPLSMNEATKRYEGYVQNIQDSIYTIESHLGVDKSFSFNAAQAITNLQQVDLFQEEKSTTLAIQVFEEYKKMISNERKRRSMMTVIQAKKELADFKTLLKTKRRSDRVRVKPYDLNKEQQAASAETINVPLVEED